MGHRPAPGCRSLLPYPGLLLPSHLLQALEVPLGSEVDGVTGHMLCWRGLRDQEFDPQLGEPVGVSSVRQDEEFPCEVSAIRVLCA